MDPLVIGQIIELTVAATIQTQTALNIYHAWVTGPLVGAPTVQDVANGMDAYWDVQYKALMSSAWRYRGTGARIINTLVAHRMFAGVTGAGPGTGAATALPTQSRGIISWGTQYAGRAQRGRTYIPGPSTAAVDANGIPVAGYVTAAQTLANKWNAGAVTLTVGANTFTFTPILWHRKPKTFDIVTTGVAKALMATQRRSGSYGRSNAPPF